MKRIHMHWTAGTNAVSTVDRKHYHAIIDGEGNVHDGDLKPEANLSTGDGVYAAHTRRANTGAIGVAVAAMHGAKERPFDAGDFPITTAQVRSLVKLVAELADTYDIPITPETVLTHAEVQGTLGIKQRGKWDIMWLPGMDGPAAPRVVGDALREMIREEMALDFQIEAKPDVVEASKETRKPRSSIWQSKTIRSQIASWFSTGGVGVLAWLNTADDTTKYIVAGLLAVGIIAGAVVFSERIRKWVDGDR